MLKEFQKFKGWKVLEYFLRGDGKTSIRELARRLKISSMTAKRYCDLLERSGLLVSERGGTAKLFSMEQNVLTKHWRLSYILQLINDNGITAMINNPFYLYGSVSKGTWGRDSDLDLFIIKIHEFDEKEVRETIAKVGFAPSIISIDFYELSDYKKTHAALIEEVKKGIYIGDEAHGLQ